MLSEYKANSGQSLIDVCLNTYGTTDYIYKLIQDSGIDNLDYVPVTGDVFKYDISLTVNSDTSRTQVITDTRFATLSNTDITNYTF